MRDRPWIGSLILGIALIIAGVIVLQTGLEYRHITWFLLTIVGIVFFAPGLYYTIIDRKARKDG